MGKDNGGRRVWYSLCPWCGKRYVLTNFMALKEDSERGGPYASEVKCGGGVWVSDTHLRACERKAAASA